MWGNVRRNRWSQKCQNVRGLHPWMPTLVPWGRSYPNLAATFHTWGFILPLKSEALLLSAAPGPLHRLLASRNLWPPPAEGAEARTQCGVLNAEARTDTQGDITIKYRAWETPVKETPVVASPNHIDYIFIFEINKMENQLCYKYESWFTLRYHSSFVKSRIPMDRNLGLASKGFFN